MHKNEHHDIEVTGKDHFPDDPGFDTYVLPFRSGWVEFTHGPDQGNWEVAAFNAKGRDLWSCSTALWNSKTFSEARREAHKFFKMGKED